jgi:hypothetical protein
VLEASHPVDTQTCLRAALQVAVLYGQPVFRVTATKLIKPSADFDAGEQRCVDVDLLAATCRLVLQLLTCRGGGRVSQCYAS